MTLFFQGGAGKHFAFGAALAPEVACGNTYDVLCAWPQFFVGQFGIRRALNMTGPYLYEDYCQGKEVLWVEPYRQPGYFDGTEHLIQSCINELRLQVTYDPAIHRPPLPQATEQQRALVRAVGAAGKYILMQFWGSTPNPQNVARDPGAKTWPAARIEKFLVAFKKAHPKITMVNYGFDAEVPAEVALIYKSLGVASTNDIPVFLGPHILQEAVAFVAIDSCLQHYSAAEGAARGVVLWGSTNPKNLGYPSNINLTAECSLGHPHCNRPYPTMPTSDFDGAGNLWQCPSKSCIHIDHERVLDAVTDILKEGK